MPQRTDLPNLYYLTNLHQGVIVTLRRGTGRRGLRNVCHCVSPDNPMSAHESRVVSIGQYGSTDSEPSAAPSALSLSMMRQAFGGLRVNTERSLSSSTEQRGELERLYDGADRIDRAPNAFLEETYSFHSVDEAHVGLAATDSFDSRDATVSSRRFSRTESTEFFEYLLAIGGS